MFTVRAAAAAAQAGVGAGTGAGAGASPPLRIPGEEAGAAPRSGGDGDLRGKGRRERRAGRGMAACLPAGSLRPRGARRALGVNATPQSLTSLSGGRPRFPGGMRGP